MDELDTQLQFYESTYRNSRRISELEGSKLEGSKFKRLELEGSACVLELDGQDTSMAGPPQVQSPRSRPEDNHNQRGQSLLLHTTSNSAALRSPARVLTEVTNRMHMSHNASRQITVESASPDISPIHMWTNSVRNSHVPFETVITPSESLYTPSTASPVSPTRRDSQDQSHRPYVLAQIDASNCRESSFSVITDYDATQPHGAVRHNVASLDNSHRSPTPPNVLSSQDSGSQSGISEPQWHAANFPRINQCSCISHPSTYPSQIPPFTAEYNLNSHYVRTPEEHTPCCHFQHYSQNQHKYEYNKWLFQYRNSLPQSHEETLLIYNAEPADWNQLLGSTMSPTDQLHVGERPVAPLMTMEGENRKWVPLADAYIPIFRPLPCSICYIEFNGRYQRGNLKRHLKQNHRQEAGTIDESDRTCRICARVYKRPDARRKHEWKKHHMEDSKPAKRRKEKKEA
jgi:hypothetical protein